MIPISYPRIIKVQNPEYVDTYCKEYVTTTKGRKLLIIKNLGLICNVDEGDYECIDRFLNNIKGNVLVKTPDINYIKSLTLVLEHRCNFKCDYCFAIEHDVCHSEDVLSMSIELISKEIDLFLNQIPQGSIANITLFGGEPLLHKKFLLILDIIDEKMEKFNKLCNVVIFTNGSLITEKIVSKIKSKGYYKLIISIDGPPILNDRHRIMMNGSSASSLLKENLNLLKKIDSDRIIGRITISDNDVCALARIKYIIEELKIPNVTLEVAFNKDKKEEYITRVNQLMSEFPDICNYYVAMLKNRQKINIGIISEVIATIIQPFYPLKNKKNCPAGTKNIAIDTNGSKYPCHRQINNISHDEKQICTIHECEKCWAHLWCDKICPSIASDVNYDPEIIGVICNYNKTRILSAVDVLLDLYGNCTPVVKKWHETGLL